MLLTIISGSKKSGKTRSLCYVSVMSALESKRSIVLVASDHQSHGYLKQQMIESLQVLKVLKFTTSTVLTLTNNSIIHVLAPTAAIHMPYMNIDEVYADEPNAPTEKLIKRCVTKNPKLRVQITTGEDVA